MRTLAILLVMTAMADAKPLPKGLVVGTAKGRPIATRDGVTVILNDDDMADFGKVAKVELNDKGDAVAITAARCGFEDATGVDPTEFPLAMIDGKLENAIGMGFHLKKQYDKAIEHFALAVAKDPRPIYATNLLSAQSLGGKLDDADKTIATWGPKSHGWFAWRFAVDSDLKPLLARPSVKDYRVGKPGTAHAAKLGAAYSPIGLAAIVTSEVYEGIGGSIDHFAQIVDTTSGVVLMSLPIGTDCAEEPPNPPDKACVKKEAAHAAVLQKKVDAVFAQLGFDAVPAASVTALGGDARTITAPDGRKLVIADANGGGSSKLTIGKVTKDVEIGWTSTAAFVPKALITTIRQKNKTRCDDGLYYWTVDVMATP